MEFIIMDGVNMEEIKSMFFITCFTKLESGEEIPDWSSGWVNFALG